MLFSMSSFMILSTCFGKRLKIGKHTHDRLWYLISFSKIALSCFKRLMTTIKEKRITSQNKLLTENLERIKKAQQSPSIKSSISSMPALSSTQSRMRKVTLISKRIKETSSNFVLKERYRSRKRIYPNQSK